MNQKCYMAWASDSEIVLNSSSGGIFTVLALSVLRNHGVVYGAEMNKETYDLLHTRISEEEELDRIKKSKYYQSNAWNVFPQVKKDLTDGVNVLFSGTACQIAGLKAYLCNTPSANLITVEILCHGVSNKRVLLSFLESQQRRFKRKISGLSFRTKKVPWKDGGGSSTTLFFDDGSEKILGSNESAYMLGFNHNLILRPSCYQCRFSGINRVADITLADFWGVKKEDAGEKHLKSGVSFCMVNTETGEKTWNRIISDIEFGPAMVAYAAQYNMAFVQPVKMHPKRSVFFDSLGEKDFGYLITQCLFKERVKYYAWKILGDKGIHIFKKLSN